MNRTIKIYVEGNAEEITVLYREVKDFVETRPLSVSIEDVDIE